LKSRNAAVLLPTDDIAANVFNNVGSVEISEHREPDAARLIISGG
jgi:hypothetical protein